jgi:hypothetical protein
MRAKFVLLTTILISSFLSSIPISAQDAASVKSFIEAAYRHYNHGGSGIDLTGPQAGQFFDPSLIALARKDQKAALPDIGAVDADVLCACQDWNGIWDLKIAVRMEGEARAVAAVSFALREPKDRTSEDLRALDITLAAAHGKWRIHDIVDHSDPKAPFALRAALEKDIQDLADLAQANKRKAAR